MAKRKPKKSSNDTRVASIVLGLFAAALILVFVFSKAKETKPENYSPLPRLQAVVPAQPVETYNPQPQENVPEVPPPVENINASGSPKVAIILDDWGYTMANCKYLHEIPEPLAVSILPGLRHTKDIATCARINHKVAMLHLPLEAMANTDYYPANYIIKTTMKPSLVTQIVEGDLNQLPSIEGVNNHMGSKATADRALMRIVFTQLRERGLFFVDSMTSSHSISAKLAGQMGLRFGKRDVFLDNVNTKESIEKQFVVLAQRAKRHGYAVAIGHDRPVTMQNLKAEIRWLEKQGIEIVSIKDLLQ